MRGKETWDMGGDLSHAQKRPARGGEKTQDDRGRTGKRGGAHAWNGKGSDAEKIAAIRAVVAECQMPGG